jgi:hypothetical protein
MGYDGIPGFHFGSAFPIPSSSLPDVNRYIIGYCFYRSESKKRFFTKAYFSYLARLLSVGGWWLGVCCVLLSLDN